jgi:GTP pyrophosphokinase
MVGAKINGIGVKISTEIKNGDVVELITRNNAQPSLDWLEHAHSQHTRNKIRGFFRKRNRSENEARGRDALEKGFKAVNIDPRQGLSDDVMTEVAKQIRDAVTPSDVMARVGEGLTSVQSVVDRVLAMIRERRPPETPAAPVPAPAPKKPEATMVRGVLDNVMLKRARCCMPVPGDEVIGYVTRGRGIMIHRRLCPNALRMQGEEAERLTPIEWLADEHTHPVDLMIITINRHGLLMDITTILAESKAGVSHANIRTLPNHTAEIAVTLEVRDAKHLREVMTKIGNYSDVISILRATGSPSGPGPARKRK